MRQFIPRYFSASKLVQSRFPLKISPEVSHAITSKSKPVVSLESTIITHGLPYPNNLAMAQEVEELIRSEGAIPATCAFIDGVPYVGLTSDQLSMLAKESANGKINKVSRRDIGYTMASKLHGGTTIASTMILSHKAGIQVFATGGLGGVHKDGQNTFDVSADLTELGRTPVAVVCSGPKSILDIGLTMEYLETQGVFVGTYNDDGRKNIEVPGFYCRESGLKSPYSFNSFESAASIIHQQNSVMGLQSGSVFCIPPPVESALSSSFINEIIDRANTEATLKGISGKELTPFLLSKIATDTQGRSVECNIKFVLNNAKAAAKIATSLLHQDVEHTPVISTVQEPKKETTSFPDQVKTVIIGSVALDTISTLGSITVMHDSNPGSVSSSTGGVGYNVHLASHYAKGHSRLVSIVGNDLSGNFIVKEMDARGLDTSGIKVAESGSTAHYSSTHASDGDLIVACADMKIVEQDFSQHIIEQLQRSKPQNVVIDCNLSPRAINRVLHYLQTKAPETNVIIEPTSQPKAARIAQLNTGVFPHNTIALATPTVAELESIYSAFNEGAKFDDFDEWFPLLDSLGINTIFREKMNALSLKKEHENKVWKMLLDKGILQQSFQLLPFIPNLLIKLGSNGLLSVSVSTSVKDYNSIPTTSSYKPSITLRSEGKVLDDKGATLGIVIQYFPIPEENKNLAIKNVTGAGDSLLGFLAARLSSGEKETNWLQPELKSVEQEWGKWELLHKAQLASGLSLLTEESISKEIEHID